MTKLPLEKKFIDFSDYARPAAVSLVNLLLPTKVGAYSLTVAFLISGAFSAYLIYIDRFPLLSAFLILLKSMLDAADGEIARRKNQPSLVGRYMDSIFDFIVNILIFLSIALRFNQSLWLMFFALILFQLQGTVFNYYYLIKRYQANGDRTSRIFEWNTPVPLKRDNQILLLFFHKIYLMIYAWQDFLIFLLDKNAIKTGELPGWFLSAVSLLGLGFQLLIISFLIIADLHKFTFIFFIYYSFIAVIVILMRKLFIN